MVHQGLWSHEREGSDRYDLSGNEDAQRKRIFLLLCCSRQLWNRFSDGTSPDRFGSCRKCSNYVGETIDDAKALGKKGILLIGHVGKFVKLAAGVMNTHSRQADCRMEVVCLPCGYGRSGYRYGERNYGVPEYDRGSEDLKRKGTAPRCNAVGNGTDHILSASESRRKRLRRGRSCFPMRRESSVRQRMRKNC